MSGIPQELVQRLAQELLSKARLKAALDTPPAITLATEEAAAAREEAGLTVPATAEQATPEEIPRGIHPFLQRLARHTVDDAAGPSTSFAQPPPSEEPGEPPTSADKPPSPAADIATTRRSAAEAWPEVRDELRVSRAGFIRVRSRMQAAAEALDGFLLEYLQEGRNSRDNFHKELQMRERPKPSTAQSTTVERTYARRLVQWSWRERNSLDFIE